MIVKKCYHPSNSSSINHSKYCPFPVRFFIDSPDNCYARKVNEYKKHKTKSHERRKNFLSLECTTGMYLSLKFLYKSSRGFICFEISLIENPHRAHHYFLRCESCNETNSYLPIKTKWLYSRFYKVPNLTDI